MGQNVFLGDCSMGLMVSSDPDNCTRLALQWTAENALKIQPSEEFFPLPIESETCSRALRQSTLYVWIGNTSLDILEG